MELKTCKCGCGQKLRKDNKTGYQKKHRPCAVCGTPVNRSDTECCSKICSAKLHWQRHPEMRETRVWNEKRTKARSKNLNWRKNCSIAALRSYQNGRIQPNTGKYRNLTLTQQERFDKRALPEYRKWIRQVLTRDNFICQVTGECGGKLSAHHLWSWDKHPEKRLDVSNGVTLARHVHKKFHDTYGRGNNTPEQFEEFRTKYSSFV